jgi:DNA replication protein DnaC
MSIEPPPLSVCSAIDTLNNLDEIWSWTDEQWAAHEARLSEERARRDQVEEVERWKRLSAKGFPQRAINAARGADEKRATIARLASWDPSERSALVIAGPAGCGKTVAATWWAARQDHAPAFVRATTFAASSRYDRDTRATWFEASALVLDDLGAEYLDAKGSFLVDLDELVDVFYGDRKPLLITTNCSAIDFGRRYGERVVDRIRECAAFWSTDDKSMRSRLAP